MTHEEQILTTILSGALYIARRGRGEGATHDRIRENLYQARKELLTAMRRMGRGGRARVPMKVMMGAWRVLLVSRQPHIEACLSERAYKKLFTAIVDACEHAMAAPKLSSHAEQRTLMEQAAGRMTLAAHQRFLDDF